MTLEDEFNHVYSPLHFFCRLKDIGIPEATAKRLSKTYEEKVYSEVVALQHINQEAPEGLEDVTNSCRYQIEPHHTGGIFYNIQADETMYWRTVALYVKGELECFNKNYVVRMEGPGKTLLKVYKKK